MNFGRYRWPLRLAVLLVAGVALFLWGNANASKSLTIQNRSGAPITRLRVTVAGQSHTFETIADGATVATPFTIQADDPFSIDGRQASRMIRMQGVVTGDRTNLVVLPGGIELRPPGRE